MTALDAEDPAPPRPHWEPAWLARIPTPPLRVIVAGNVVAVGAALALILPLFAHDDSPPAIAAPLRGSDLIREAGSSCGALFEPDLSAVTVTVPPGWPMTNVHCWLTHLGAPGWVENDMADPASIQGVQHSDWSVFTAAWSYHPQIGLQLTIATTD